MKTSDPTPAAGPGTPKALLSHLLSFAAGLLAAFVVFYVLYRIGLPSKPFIYVAF